MFNFPFFRFPYSNYYYPYYNNYIHNNKDVTNIEELNTTKKKINSESKEIKKGSYKYNFFGPISFINPFNESFNKNEPVLEILGLKLYLDDLIILGLLFLLYTEDVHDDILFLTLILLLIS